MVSGEAPLAHLRVSKPGLVDLLHEEGISAIILTHESDPSSVQTHSLPDLALIDTSSLSESDLKRWARLCQRIKLPVIALVPETSVTELDPELAIEDFVLTPLSPPELVARARKALARNKTPKGAALIRVGDLVIDPTGYEVRLRGERVALRFKEYELLRFLASNPGRVYTREALLRRIWGYDYFGGTRTVDVHIRRLRSKIEDTDHAFIDTIRHVGYRFRDLEQER